ncbi:MAG: glutamyl-tRNA reductase [Pirellulales bacterium]|nr:glutamyl-tRNA reductase [Pirellulales bacterium]
MKLLLVGCSHQTAEVALRERLAFSPHQAEQALARWRDAFPATEGVLISTCNRVEMYAAADHKGDLPTHRQVAEFLADCQGLNPHDIFNQLFEHSGETAVRHLFTVAASLDSMVVGEPQILAQVKQAYHLAQRQNCAGPLTHDAFQSALRAAKRVAGETRIHEKRVSIPSVAVGDFAQEIFARFDDKVVVVIGAGEMADETLSYVRAAGARQPRIVNRHDARAIDLAAKHHGVAVPWAELDQQLAAADLIISTTGASQPVVTLERYERFKDSRYQRPLIILDLAVPRDFDPRIGDELNVFLYTLDDLQAACQRNRQEREGELPRALSIIEDETARFMTDVYHRATRPIIQQLRSGWHAICDAELQRLYHKLPDLDAAARQEIEQTFERFVNKLLHPPLESLRAEARQGTPHGLLDALKRLFRLEE